MLKINMMSAATSIKGQGVGSAYLEQLALLDKMCKNKFDITVNNKKVKADINHYHTINPDYLVHKFLNRKKTVSVGSVHFLPETMEDSLALPRFAKAVLYKYVVSYYHSMDHLVVVNPWFIERLNSYGIPKERVTYIPNFVSSENFFRCDDEKRAEIRKQYGIAKDAFVILGVGQLQTRKGIIDFIEIAKRTPEATFIWAGDYAMKNISKGKQEIEKAIKKAPENAKFLGLVEREDMNKIYNLANVMFLPSFEELFPMAILEAMSCNVPILLRDLDIYNDILFDYYYKENDVESFCQIIKKLKNDKDFYKKGCEMAARGDEFYSEKHVAELWEQFYNKIVHDAKIKK